MPAWRQTFFPQMFNKLTCFLISAVLLSTLPYTSSASRSHRKNLTCLFDAEDRNQYFSLLDPSDGIPFTNIDGHLRKISQVDHPLPKFSFSKPAGNHFNTLDVRLGSSYVALFDSGRLGFTNKSSDGAQPTTHGDESFVTSIFHISCDGVISIRLPVLVQYIFIYHAPSNTVLGRPNGNPQGLIRRDSAALRLFVRQSGSAVDQLPHDSWSPFSFLVGPFKVSDHDQIGFQPRCPLKPFGLVSYVKPGARPAFFNGCGAENGMKVPDYRFTDCCDAHDLCYDDCSMTWDSCNNDFRQCMHNQCDDKEPTWSNWGCNNLADAYADMVGTRLGAWAFSNSNYDRCTCGCPTGTMNCTDICLRDCKERCNFIDCSKEKSTSLAPTVTTTSKTSTSSVTSTSATKKSSTSSSTTTLSSSITTSKSSSKTKSTSSHTSSLASSSSRTALPDPSAAVCLDGESWWPFDFWVTQNCPKLNVAVSNPERQEPESWWPALSWFTTTNSPSKNVKVTSSDRTETTIWWWPFM